MEPVVDYEMPDEEYRALKRLNQSVLKKMDTKEGGSPKHAKAAFDGLLKFDTDTLRLGRAEHCLIVEGDEAFHSRYEISEPCQAILASGKNKGKACGQVANYRTGEMWVCGQHKSGEQTVEATNHISHFDYERIKAMVAAVRDHAINVHLRRPGWAECTILYDVPIKGATLDRSSGTEKTIHIDTLLPHKARLDRLAPPVGSHPHLIVDLKRMQVGTGDQDSRERTILRYGWDVQAAMYTEAVRIAFGVKECQFLWIFVEEQFPFDVVPFAASADTLEIGANKLLGYRREWAKCEALGVWPGACEGIRPDGGLPEWYVKAYRQEFGVDGKLQVEE